MRKKKKVSETMKHDYTSGIKSNNQSPVLAPHSQLGELRGLRHTEEFFTCGNKNISH